MSIRGVVSKVSSNQYQGKELWSFRLNGDNNYYNTGEKVPPVQMGQPIEFDTKLSASGKHQVLVESIRPWKQEGTVGGVPALGQLVQNLNGGKDKYWSDKEARDVRNDQMRELGASRNTAINIVQLMLTQDAVTLPAKKEKKEEAIYNMIEHYTNKLMGKGTTDLVEPTQTSEETVNKNASEWS